MNISISIYICALALMMVVGSDDAMMLVMMLVMLMLMLTSFLTTMPNT